MKGRDRNTPCWCGSGIKFKKCHYKRDGQPRDNPWAAMAANKQAFSKKKCSADGVGLGSCDGGVVSAHTVSRGPNLSKIAKDGHVLCYSANDAEMKKNGGKLSVKKIGIRGASVFYGFCSKHDRELFACIENDPFVGRPDQCLAVAYRTISRELYGKDATEHLRETLRGADKGLKSLEQSMLQHSLELFNTGVKAAQQDLRATYNALTKALVDVSDNTLRSVVFEFSGSLPFMFAGAWSPFTDFYGNELQNGYVDKLLEQIFVSSFADDASAMICVSWLNIDDAPGEVIAEQIKALPDDKQASALLQFVLKHVENIFFDPDWFQELDDKQSKKLYQLAADGVDFMGSVPSAFINLDMDFRLPVAVRSFQV